MRKRESEKEREKERERESVPHLNTRGGGRGETGEAERLK